MPMKRAPVVFVGHGASTLTTVPSDATHQFQVGYASTIQRWGPFGFVVVSAHFSAWPIRVTSSASPVLLHDHPASKLYSERYDCPGAPTLAEDIVTRLSAAGLKAVTDPTRGLDHGAWLPLRHFRPAADRFVVQVSLPNVDWQAAVVLGEVLSSVRERAIVLASGGLTHDQGEFRRRYFAQSIPAQPAPEPHQRFERWALNALHAPDAVKQLSSAGSHSAFGVAHPTPEHFLPAVVAAAAAAGDTATSVYEGVQHGLSTSAVVFGLT